MNRRRSVLSYANVTATLALVIAMSGGAYAATQLPKNSVGTKQLKSNAVTSAKVDDGSLLSSDFKAGQIPAGPAGPPGSNGSSLFTRLDANRVGAGTAPILTQNGVTYTLTCLTANTYPSITFAPKDGTVPYVTLDGVGTTADAIPFNSASSDVFVVHLQGEPWAGLATGPKYTGFYGTVTGEGYIHQSVSVTAWMDASGCHARGYAGSVTGS